MRRSRPEPRPLAWAAPEAAFRARAGRDRLRLALLSRALAQPASWTRASASLAEMERLAHGLAGAAGVFGFPVLGEAAARLERMLERWRRERPMTLSRQRLTALRLRLEPLLDALAAAAA